MNKLITILVLTVALGSSALARESTEIIGARYLGMGDCFIACSRDRSILFANPAALDRPDGRMFTAMGLVSSVNSKTTDVVRFALDHRKDFENVSDMSEADQNAFFDDIVNNINFKRMNLMLSIEPFGMIQRPVGGTVFSDSRATGMAFRGASGTPLVDADLRQDFGGIVGFGWGWTGLRSFLPNRLSVGASLKYIHRSIFSTRETVTELSDGEGAKMLNGTTVGLDLGLLYDINSRLCVGAAIYDAIAGDIKWKGDSTTYSRVEPGDIEKIEPALRLGVTCRLPWNVPHLSSELVAFDLNEPFDGDVSFFKKIHAGIEASVLASWFKVRMGISQGYPTVGLSVFGLTYAYYTEEEGRHAGQLPDRRHVISFGL
ncbi:MAG TPA: hypothetical protein VMU02_10245 [bacterium]|nr:hypothetical protein [bacterium]